MTSSPILNNLVTFDYSDGSINFYTVDPDMEESQVVEFLQEKGYHMSEIEWMYTGNNSSIVNVKNKEGDLKLKE